MIVEVLTKKRIGDFIQYCKKHRSEIDNSFLDDNELNKFVPNDENPTYIILEEQGDISAAASLMIDDYNRRGKRARFRILHSEKNDITYYELLMKALLKHTVGINQVYIFIPFVNKCVRNMMEQLHFIAERHVFLLVRDENEIPGYEIPVDYSIRNFKPREDEEIWCQVRNAGFAKLKGNETPTTQEMVAKMVSREDYLDGGMKILFHKDKPVGVVRGANDEYENTPIMNIGPLAILPEYQGKGLGRLLLRVALEYASEKSYKKTILSVNGENEHAKTLYINEGFKEVEGVTCYVYDVNQ
jgi:mycothiol synthase